MCTIYMPAALGYRKMGSDPLQLELWIVWDHYVVSGIKPGSLQEQQVL